jgi:hypothetical protein
MRDDDGQVFVNYLGALFDEPYDVAPDLRHHLRVTRHGVERFRTHRRTWEKYRWVAEYHNSVTRSMLPNRHDLLLSADDLAWGFRPFAAAAD